MIDESTNYISAPIGVFDSGLGGLTVVHAIQKHLPHESIVYLGDTAHVPYGNRSADMVCSLAINDVKFLLQKHVKAIVVACNTVSALALDMLLKQYPNVPIIGVLEPGAMATVVFNPKRIAILGTRGTISSGGYERKIRSLLPLVDMVSISCPLFVPFAEEGITDGPLLRSVFDLYLSKLKQNIPDVVLLGCTHYPLFRPLFQSYFPEGVKIIDSAETTAIFLKKQLTEYNLLSSTEKKGKIQIFVTDMTPGFSSLAKTFLFSPDSTTLNITHVNI